MTKKVKVSFLILVWSIVIVQSFVNTQDETARKEKAVAAFSVIDETVIGEVIRGYGYFGTVELSDETKQSMLENLALKLGIEDGYVFSKEEGEDFSKLILTKEGKYATTYLRIVTLESKEAPEQHITMQIESDVSAKEAFSLYERVERVYEEIGMEGNVSMELNMEQQGSATKEEKEELVELVFDLAKAKEVEAIRENDIYTVYGYTKTESSYLMLKGKKVNIQLVFTYDEIQDVTYVKVGIPIVNSSY
ncbi:MAG: YwmB family TATA-box binding protein [Lachnospiraceae bacterium]|nr:YwmB family TATA-box binding protein [Lachnospiraceae bacterium]